MTGAAGVGAVVALPGRAAAHQQSVEAIDVRAHGATGDGSTDDWAAIQSALDEVTSSNATPNVVFFPAGDYVVSKPLVPKSNTLMVGTHTVDCVADLNPPSQCKIRARSNFTGAGLVMPGGSTVGLTIRNLALVGNNVGTGVSGLRLPDQGQVTTEQGYSLEDVTIGGFSGDGIEGRALAITLLNCWITRNQGWGINAGGAPGRWTDAHITGCFFSFNRAGNIHFGGPNISGHIEVVNTRIERAGGDPDDVSNPPNPSAPGVRITSARTIRFTNCSTDANMGNGVEILHDSSSPDWGPDHIQFANCMFARDGTGDQINQGNYAGLKVVGTGPLEATVNQIKCVNCIVVAGLADDNGGGPVLGPKYGVWYDHTAFFQWIGGDVVGAVESYYTATGNNYRPLLIDLERGLMTLPLDAPATTAAIPDGSAYVDEASSTLKVRVNGAWKSATLS